MNLRGFVLPAALVVLADAWLLIGVARNRAGEPDAVVELTERELSLVRLGEENSGVALDMEWQGPRLRPVEAGRDWFDEAKLRQLGFDFGRRSRNPLPKEAYVVFEHQAPAARAGTRLFAVDVGRDPADLRRRYPDRTRYIIMRSMVRAVAAQGAPRRLRGAVVLLLPPQIYVPLPFADTLSPLSMKPAETPRYAVTLHFGRNYEPWVAGVRLLPQT